MHLSLYNSLSRQKEIFNPIDANLVKVYVCGPTVYDHPHIGNARSIVVYDVIFRILMHLFGKDSVLYVRNITDVDDKIIDRAKELNISIFELTKKTTEDFHQDMTYLNCLPPNIEPKATMHIAEMINIIEKLLVNNSAYISEKHVYFDILKATNYMELSGRSLEQMLYGVRIETNEAKKHLGDFVLWKPASQSDEASANFDSPWGRGRPGWHIECSAMSHKYLGENFDIHGGGADLIFPHHTNEIAQSTCAFPSSSFAKYWVHNGFLTAGGEKMSKSLGNFITVRDLIKQEIEGDIIRLLLLSSHYRKPLDYNKKAVLDSEKILNYWYRAVTNIDLTKLPSIAIPNNFLTSLYDDINTPLAIKIINDYAKNIQTANDQKTKLHNAASLISCANFLGLMTKPANIWFNKKLDNSELINSLIAARYKAKQDKDWSEADVIRKKLLDMNIITEDHKDGSSSWYKKHN